MKDLAEEIRTARNFIATGRALLCGLRKEMLTMVSPAKLKRYMESLGYFYVQPWGENGAGWFGHREHVIIVPTSVSREDWDEALLDVIEKLARWHGQKKIDVLHSIVRVGEA